MKILVTGGSGFIGSHLVSSLLGEGHDIRVMDNFDPQVHEKGVIDTKGIEIVKGDVRNVKSWEKSLEDIDAVYHMAAAVGISQSMHRPAHYLETNTIGTANLYEVLLNNPTIRKGLNKIIIPGSKTIYGEGSYSCKNCGIVYPELRGGNQLEKHDWEVHCPKCKGYVTPVGIKEDKPINPISVYALSKFDAENIAMNYAHAFNIPTIVFRGFSIYGPGQSLSNPYSGVCSIFLSRIKNGKSPVIFEDGKQLRDYIFIDDAIDFLLGVLMKDVGGVYNMGSGNPSTVNDICNTLIEITGSKVKPEITGDYRLGDNRHDFADISKSEKEIGFNPRWNIRSGLEKLVEWGENQKAKDDFDKSESIRKEYFNKHL